MKNIENEITQPCPFCKDTLPLEVSTALCECKQHKWVYVECMKCGTQGPHALLDICPSFGDLRYVEQIAIQRWNEGLKND